MTKVVDLDKVSKTIEISESLTLVLIDRLGQEALHGSIECARNIYLLDEAGQVVWQVVSDFDTDGGAFTNIILSDGRIQAYRWDGGMYDIDVETGKAVPGLLVR
ncbi:MULTISPECIES: hypothetical protein [Pseudomonas]|uniref:Lipoprotein n=1 Tax=Pseudomonas aphyarum TaxID=2942629 RepID=A0ABT5PKV3_9PSED|nr:hypothetical protein [Pseudomonas aphyarum]MDD0968533.1 hypothetical protein [Pseudomonas aphyarum]MDD1124433.1 hypothetical protein [Pseudomonas aphyarum]